MAEGSRKMIGVVGGVGSYAGLDLIHKIYDLTEVRCDQDHLAVAMLSVPHGIADRTEFLTGCKEVNPGFAIADVVNGLSLQGADIVAIPCNTAHAPRIFDRIREHSSPEIEIAHMIDCVVEYVNCHYDGIARVGLLATTGTMESRVYHLAFAAKGIEILGVPSEFQQFYVQSAIYDREYGIKANSAPFPSQARVELEVAVSYLKKKGAEAVVLGCSEIPLVIRDETLDGLPLIDATWILARRLVERVAPFKLKCG